MANIIANEKRHNQDKKRHVLIHSQLSAVKTQIKKTKISKKKEDLNLCYKMIDNIVSKGIITKNKGNRLKSRLALFLNNKDSKYVSDTKKKVVKKAKPIVKEEPKKVVKKETPKPIVRKVDEESLRREKEQLKVVEAKPVVEKEIKGQTKKGVEAPPIIEKTSIIMISIDPTEAESFLNDDTKNVLFYKVTPVNKVNRVLIYATAPTKGVIGEFDLDKIEICALSTAWRKYSQNSVLTKKAFDEYYEGKEKAHIMLSKKSFWYSKPKTLKEFNMTKGPSGFQYLK